MNVQELIKRIRELAVDCSGPRPMIDKLITLDLVKQLDEPQPVKVPQFVADWYEENKDVFEGNLYRCAYNIPSAFDSAKLNEFERWFLTAGTKPFQTLVNMHQFGYEAEKEKRYLVKFKGFNSSYIILKHHHYDNTWFLGGEQEYEFYRLHHTRKQLEDADFGWVFDCPGVEVEEVE